MLPPHICIHMYNAYQFITIESSVYIFATHLYAPRHSMAIKFVSHLRETKTTHPLLSRTYIYSFFFLSEHWTTRPAHCILKKIEKKTVRDFQSKWFSAVPFLYVLQTARRGWAEKKLICSSSKYLRLQNNLKPFKKPTSLLASHVTCICIYVARR